MTLHKESGVEYTFNKEDAEHTNMKEFRYFWEFIPSGGKGKKTVYTHNDACLLELINHWNIIGRGKWLFTR